MGVRVTGISAVFHGFSVEKNPRNPAKVTVFGGTLDFGIYEGTARVTEILHGINVEKFPQTLLKVAGADGGNIRETAALVAEISLLLNSINVEKNLQVPVTIPFSIKLGFVEFYKKGEWKNGGTSDGVFARFQRWEKSANVSEKHDC